MSDGRRISSSRKKRFAAGWIGLISTKNGRSQRPQSRATLHSSMMRTSQIFLEAKGGKQVVIIPRRYCTRCREEITLKRIKRGSCYCSSECRRKAKNEMRDYRGQFECKHCGRPPLKRRCTKPKPLLPATRRGRQTRKKLEVESFEEFRNRFERLPESSAESNVPQHDPPDQPVTVH